MAENREDFDELEEDVCILTDEDGNESPFEVIGSLELDGCEYLAFMPVEGDECEYVILKKERDENGEDVYVTIDDDDEFEQVAELFEDQVFADLDLDELEDDGESGEEEGEES